MESNRAGDLSANIYKALGNSTSPQQALKQLNQKDRAIVLIALDNLRFHADPDKVKQILPDEADRVVILLTASQVKHAQSSFFGRLFKGIQNLFGRISSETLVNKLIDVNSATSKDTLIDPSKQEQKPIGPEKIKFSQDDLQTFEKLKSNLMDAERDLLLAENTMLSNMANPAAEIKRCTDRIKEWAVSFSAQPGNSALVDKANEMVEQAITDSKDPDARFSYRQNKPKSSDVNSATQKDTLIDPSKQEQKPIRSEEIKFSTDDLQTFEKLKSSDVNSATSKDTLIDPFKQQQKPISPEEIKFRPDDLQTFEKLKSNLMDAERAYQQAQQAAWNLGPASDKIRNCTASIEEWANRFDDQPGNSAFVDKANEMVEQAITDSKNPIARLLYHLNKPESSTDR